MGSKFTLGNRRVVVIAVATTLLLATAVVAIQPAQAQTLTVLYSFTGGADGGQPYSSLIFGPQGKLYGTTAVGGANGYGVAFVVNTRNNKEKVLHDFTLDDGANPWAGLLYDGKTHKLYGTTEAGGASGFGTVFEIHGNGTQFKVIYDFAGGSDGSYPFCQLIRSNHNGKLYGTTYRGGATDSGTVFSLSGTGKEKVEYSFQGGEFGENPYAGLAQDSDGRLYGITFGDFTGDYGTVFRAGKSGGRGKILHTFTGGDDGGFPYFGGLVADPAGNFFGTTSFGGANKYFGTVYKINKNGKQTVLYSFTGGTDGGQPNAGLVRDSAGNLYGTTVGGGAFGHGTIFELDKNGTETVLYSFAGGTDPAGPNASLLLDGAGNLYGTSIAGGTYTAGTIFVLTRDHGGR